MEASRALQQEFVAGVDSVLDILQAEGINADQHKGGALVAAHTRAGLGRLVTRREADLKYGLTEDDVHLLDRDEFQSRSTSPPSMAGSSTSIAHGSTRRNSSTASRTP